MTLLYVPNDATGPLGVNDGYLFAQRLYQPMSGMPLAVAYPIPGGGFRCRSIAIHPQSEVRGLNAVYDLTLWTASGGLDGGVPVIEGEVTRFSSLVLITHLDRLDMHDGKALLLYDASSDPLAVNAAPVLNASRLSITLPAGYMSGGGKVLYQACPREGINSAATSLNYSNNKEGARMFGVATQTGGVGANTTTHAVVASHAPPYAPLFQAAGANIGTWPIAAGSQTVLTHANGLAVQQGWPADGFQLQFPNVANGVTVLNTRIHE